ncbi:MAG: phosphate transport regulator [Bdellovibrionales bacterium GWA2_49_15]|nr:MAG: phosphate transport regulator [Bdellovibrionales bacterium GWA2_49_15]HAZ12922.1 DUF47 domain-containing protein [Bdellovibrionales bacterium]
MFGRFMPREEKFFDLFDQAATLILESTQRFRTMLDDMGNVESHSRVIKDLEHKCDEITHRTVDLLHTTFITPLDRNDIHALISKLDDILDLVEAASQRMFLYNVTKVTPELMALADVGIKSVQNLKEAVSRLHNLKNPEEIIKYCVEVNRLENEADHILRSAMAKLFREEPDVRRLIMFKELYEMLETMTDRCEDVANIIEGIVLEYA